MASLNRPTYPPHKLDPFSGDGIATGKPAASGNPEDIQGDIGEPGDSKAAKRPSDAAIYRSNSSRFFARGVDTLFNTGKKLPAAGILSDESAGKLLNSLKQKGDKESFVQAASAALTDAHFRRGCDPTTKAWISDIQAGKLDFRNITMLQKSIPNGSLLNGVIDWLKDKTPEQKRDFCMALTEFNKQKNPQARISKL